MAEKNGLNPETYTTAYIKSDWDNTTFLGNPHLDSLTLALHAMGQEVWRSRRRMHVIEALLERKIAVTREAIEKYLPTAEEEQLWKADRDRMIEEVFAPFVSARNISYTSAVAQAYDPQKANDKRAAFEAWDKEAAEPEFHPAGGPRK